MPMLLYYLPCIFTAIICYFSFRESQWIRKKRNGMMFLLLSTLVISPFLIGSQIEINAYYYGSPSVSANFSLSPGEHNKLGPLSNQGALRGSDFWIQIFVENGNVTFYIVDENRPDVFYYLDIYANETFLSVSLSYPVANWTANYYNPSQNQTIEVDTQIMLLVILISPSPLAQRMQVLLIPHQILATLWICAGAASSYQWRLKANERKASIE
ncbi:MAG: hypothetical protein ACFFFK_09150 [Candidatus Thorarchaeota archaeon]